MFSMSDVVMAQRSDVKSASTNEADLIVTKLNTIETGNAMFGVPFFWAFEMENLGFDNAVFNNGDVILRDQLPPGADYVSVGPLMASGVRAQNGAAVIDCTIDVNLLFTCVLTSGGPLDVVQNVVVPIGGIEVTPTIASGELVNPTGGICRVDPDNVIFELNDESNGTDNNDCSDTVIVQPPMTKLAAPESVRVTTSFNIPFWCGERKDEFTMDGVDFVNLEQYETEMEVIYPQKRILGLIPLPQSIATFVETVTITNPSNFQTPGDMTLPIRGSLNPGKTIRIHCSDITTLPTRLDENDDIVELLSQRLLDEDYFHGIFTLESSNSDIRVFVTKIVRSWKGVDQGSGIDFTESQLDRERTEVQGNRVSNTHDVLYEIDDNPAPPVPPATTSQVPLEHNQHFTLHQSASAIIFHAQDSITRELSVQIFSLHGQLISNEQSPGQSLIWNMRNEHGQRVANGVYLYVVSVRDSSGSVIRSEVRKLVVMR